jgi:hypothetical protein
MPAPTSACTVRNAGGSTAASSRPSARSASSRRPISSNRRASRQRACAAFTVSPCDSRVARAASSAFAGNARSRDTSAISASATTQARARDRLLRPEGALGAPQEVPCARKVAKLRHRNATQRERRRIVAQRHAIERADRVAGGERARRRRDHGVHANPAKLVTPTFACPSLD